MPTRLPTASIKTNADATITALQEKLSQMEKDYSKLNEQRNNEKNTLIQAFLKKDIELKEMLKEKELLRESFKKKQIKFWDQLIEQKRIFKEKEREKIIKQLNSEYDAKFIAEKKIFSQKLDKQQQEFNEKLAENEIIKEKERDKIIKQLNSEYEEKFMAQKKIFSQKLFKQNQEFNEKLAENRKLGKQQTELSEKLAEKNKIIKEKNLKMNEMNELFAEKKAALKALRLEHQEEIKRMKRNQEMKYARKFERFQKFYEVSRASKKPLDEESVEMVSTHDELDDDEEYFSCCEDFEGDEATTTTGSPAPNSCSSSQDLAEELAQTKKALADLELSMKSQTDWLCSYLDNNSVMISQTFVDNEISKYAQEKINELEEQIKKFENDRDMADFMAEIQRIEHQREIDNLELRLRDAYNLRDMI